MARCKYTGRRGQCTNASLDGSEYCRKHANENDRIFGYYIRDPELRDGLDRRADDSGVETVEGELGLLRQFLENKLNSATSRAEMEAAQTVASDWVMKINLLSQNLNKQKALASEVLGRAALERFAQEVITIVAEEIPDIATREEIIDRVAARIAGALMETRNQTGE